MQTRRLELFTTIHTEGAILPVDLLQRILDSDSSVDGTSPDSYHLGAGEKINEAVNRSWNRLQGLWLSFQNVKDKLPESDAGTTLTRDKWLLQLFQELGYGRLQKGKAIEHDNKVYDISHQWKNTLIHLVSFKVELDKRIAGVKGASKSSPHSLVQELLNASDEHLWGFVSNGLRLRILRDNKSLTRQAYVEFDIEGMMNGEVYSDFVLLWMLCHQSRVEADKPEECWLEKWSQTAQEQGTRALDQLRNGVEQAIKELGQGFLSHAGNSVLREKLKKGDLNQQEYYRQLFRLVYRLLFLFVAEDRDLLLHPKAHPDSRERYNRNYSLTRLRRMASKLRGSRHVDAWEQVRIIMDILSGDTGYDALGLPALGGYLFSDEAIPDLHDCDITNHDFLSGVRALAFIVDKGTLRPVDYKNLRSEEFGSVYESLLELHPVINADAGTFELKTAGGNERKTTASYYTHDSLVQCLLDSALDPVVDEAVKKPDPEKAILALKVCDFASGSGHFLTAAAHRMAKRLAAIRTEEEEPAPEAIRTALRDVIGHCIYGVDINPMAVELCKVALWMEALEAGKPLSFLDHHIQCGNSLIGATPALLKKGIPDEAFTPIEGDDKEVCKKYKKRNKQERGGQTSFYGKLAAEPRARYTVALDQLYESIDRIDDQTIDGIHAKEKVFKRLLDSPEYREQRGLADAWCSAFVWVKTKDGAPAITDHVFRTMVENYASTPINVLEEVGRLATQYQFFHWHLAFPDVFRVTEKLENEQTGWSGGFDVLVGNPPWEKIKLQEREWFAVRDVQIAEAQTGAIRKLLIDQLSTNNPKLYSEYVDAIRHSEGEGASARNSGFYEYSAGGDTNTYPLFIELGSRLICKEGYLGLVVKTGILADYSLKDFFEYFVDSKRLISAYDITNRKGIFSGVVANERFTLLTLGGEGISSVSFEVSILNDAVGDIKSAGRRWTLSIEDLLAINPNTKTCPLFQTADDAQIVRGIYQKMPILISESIRSNINQYGVTYIRMFDMTNDSNLFVDYESTSKYKIDKIRIVLSDYDNAQYVPVIEGKLFDIFDHRHGTFADVPRTTRFGIKAEPNHPTLKERDDPWFRCLPRYWVPKAEAESRYRERIGFLPSGVLTFRDVCRTHTDLRTVRACIYPPYGAGNKAPLLLFPGADICEHARKSILLCSNMGAIVYDYVARQKFSGGSLNRYILIQLPVVDPATWETLCPWADGTDGNHVGKISYGGFVMRRMLELTYTAWDLQPFAQDCGHNGAPFRWDEERRFLLRAELDAAYFHLYGIERDDVDYIMETFPIVKRKDEAKYGEFRKKRVILEIYDEMKEAMESGKGYKTRLAPPPADERVAHS